MAAKHTGSTFSAYTGAEDMTDDFASMRVRAADHGENVVSAADRRRAARTVLMALLLVVAGLAALNYGEQIKQFWATHTSDLPTLNMPMMDGPLLNRAITVARIETSLSRVREEEVRTVLARHSTDGFFGLDVRALRDELEEHPWVAMAGVRRVWPDTLVITIHEEKAIARWGDDSLLNSQGEMFSPENIEREAGLPRLSGQPGAQQQMMEQYQQFSQMLHPAGLRISELNVSARGAWTMTVNNGMRINIGRDQIVERIQRFLLVYEASLREQQEDIAVVDLRYNHGMAVRKKTQIASARVSG